VNTKLSAVATTFLTPMFTPITGSVLVGIRIIIIIIIIIHSALT